MHFMLTRSLYLEKLERRAIQIMKGTELRLDIEALTMIARYAHWIPITQGLYLDFFQDNYPGWEWNDIIPVLIKKRVVNINSKEPGQRMLSQGLSIALNVEGISLIRFKNRITVLVHIIE